jgi:hypothetical protein
MFNTEHLQEKWAPILEHSEIESISDPYRKAVTSILLENQEKFLREERGFLSEAAPTMNLGSSSNGFTGAATSTGPVAGFDPVLISLIRRSMPKLIAYDICGVQPLQGPTGLIFAMRTTYGTNRDMQNSATEAFFNEADTEFSSENSGDSLASNDMTGTNPAVLNDSGTYTIGGQGMTTAQSEALGDGAGNHFREMGFSIEKIQVGVKSRALKAEYTLELAQDLKAVHGLDAESELANILSTEVLAEINREVVRTVYRIARPGAQNNVATAGTFDLDVDSNGRWAVEKFKGLLFQVERDLNAIGHETRRGKGNMLICSADVASALAMAGVLDYSSGLSAATGGISNNIDDNGSTLAGTLFGRVKVFVDPYSANISDTHFYVAGYKGSTPYDAGLFYCPYVPLQMVRAVGQDTFQPKIGFKTRYGMVANPFAEGTSQGQGALNANANRYYRRVRIANLM